MLPSRPGSIFNLIDGLLQRKTIRSFAERLPSLDQLSPAVRAAVQPFLDPQDPPTLILLAPAQSVRPGAAGKSWRLSWEVTPDQVLLLSASHLLVVSSPFQPGPAREDVIPQVTSLPLGSVLYLETGFILLTAWFECAWVREGQLERTRVCFNTVSRELFAGLCVRIRTLLAEMSGCALAGPGQGLEHIASFPYKFRSLIPRHLLLEGEAIRAGVFLPSLWERRRHSAPRRALVRTSAHLVVCEEELTSADETHGLIARFVPLDRLSSYEVQRRGERLELKIRLETQGAPCWLSLPIPAGLETSLAAVLENKEGCH